MLERLRPQVGDVDVPALIARHDDDRESGHAGAGGVRAVSGLRDENDITMSLPGGAVVCVDCEQARELALRP